MKEQQKQFSKIDVYFTNIQTGKPELIETFENIEQRPFMAQFRRRINFYIRAGYEFPVIVYDHDENKHYIKDAKFEPFEEFTVQD